MGVPDIPSIFRGCPAYWGSDCEFKQWRVDGLFADRFIESGLDDVAV